MSFVNSAVSMLATCAGDTVKLFDVSNDSGGDPCTLTYTPTSGSLVNCIKWNHTNLVLASAGDDKKISLWRTNGQCIGTVPLSESEAGDNMEESIASISFSNKSSRYLCSGGSGKVVRIWDLQRKRCIKWLTGHTDTITGVMYNCKNEHLASISMKGDLIIHNLVSGARAAELKDPIGQVLRVLDYSRLSRHILVTAGDDGSVHLWDTTGRGPKVSWRKQHSAPISGVCFSPSSDKIIGSVGLDKKLYTFDTGSRKPTSCYPYEAPFSSLAYSDDGNTLAAGTNNGRIVFFDVRGKPQPITLLRAYNSSEAVTSLCWQRSKPVIVHEKNCSDETALLGGINEDSVLMPDPLPTITSSASSSSTFSSTRSSLSGSTPSSISSASCSSIISEETPHKNRLWPGGSLSKLHAPRSDYNLKDDMDVFSPLVDVQPITPSLGNWFDSDSKKDTSTTETKHLGFPANVGRFPFIEGKTDTHPMSDWRSNTASKQDSDFISEEVTTPAVSSKSESSFSPTPPEAWGGNDRFTHRQNAASMASHLLPSVPLASESTYSGLQETLSPTINSLASSRLKSAHLQNKVIFENENSAPTPTDSTALFLPRKFSTYAERISTASTFSDGIGSAMNSPKLKKTGLETRENVLTNLHLKQNSSYSMVLGTVPAINDIPKEHASRPLHTSDQPIDQQTSSSFSLQLVQRTLEETLGSMQNAIHEDVKNLHIELLRQFHMQEMEVSRQISSVLERQDELMKEVQALRRENQQLRQLL